MDRRQFLESMALLGAAAGVMPAALGGCSPAGGKGWRGKFDENLVCIISDLHTNPGSYQPEKLKRVVADILAMNPRPRNVISLGDNAYLTGKDEEYALLKEILAPLDGSGIVFTMAHGNHDRRENFVKFFPEQVASSALPDRLVHVVGTPRADLIVLDSLQEPEDTTTWITPGALDDAQKAWLESRLNATTDKPVFVMSHHPIDEVKINALLTGSPTCCGYIHGHDHVWRTDWIKKSYGSRRITGRSASPRPATGATSVTPSCAWRKTAPSRPSTSTSISSRSRRSPMSPGPPSGPPSRRTTAARPAPSSTPDSRCHANNWKPTF